MPAEARPNDSGRSNAPSAIEAIDWAAELSAVLSSDEWERLGQALAGETPGGGPCVSTLLQRAAKGLRRACAEQRWQPRQQQAQAGAGERAAAAEAGRGSPVSVTEGGGGVTAAAALVEVLQCVTWEKLHSGSWHEVPLTWRDAYSAACILAAAAADAGLAALPAAPAPEQPACRQQAAASIASTAAGAAAAAQPAAASTATQTARVAEALQQLDMAAMMGGPLLRPAVDPLASALVRRWQRLQPPRPSAPRGQPPPSPSPPQLQSAADGRGGGQAPPPAKRARTAIAALAGGELPEPGSFTAGPAAARAAGSIPLPIWSLGPRGTVLPREQLPSLESFWGRYMSRRQPCVITGAMQDWPALERWQDPEYLRSVAGPRTVPVELGRHYLEEAWGQRLMTFSQFLDDHILPHYYQAAGHDVGGGGGGGGAQDGTSHEQEKGQGQGQEQGQQRRPTGYLAQHPLFEQIRELQQDIREPPYCVLGEGEVVAVNAWYGPPGTITPLHTDPHHNLLCQVVGRKYIRLYAPDHTPAMHPREGLLSNNSTIDLDALREPWAPGGGGGGGGGASGLGEPAPTPADYSGLEEAPFADLVLEAGQMLYIPPGWWHYLKSLSPSFSVSVWWN